MGFAAWFSGKALQERLQVAEKALAEANAILGAITESVAGIIFTPSGEILEANPLFLSVVGYRKEEVVGKHHRMFCSEDYARSAEYRQFWERLQAGKPHSGRFPRRNAKGALIWLEATYFPVKGADGRVAKVIKIATDVTEQHERLRAQSAVFEALNRSMVVIEFSPDGHVLAANDNFLKTMGYRLEDIRGKHHRMFCLDSFYREQPDFWTRLQGGKFLAGKFERVRADGQDVWLEATYNPILDEQGKTVKVIKFASEITDRVQRAAKIREAAQLAATTAEQTSKIAQDGSLVLRASLDLYGRMKTRTEDARQAISQLNDQSRSIETIVATISSVADQTNLLALNAAIEAARAGEQGRGFAVVADEVRSLAARTSQATSEIADVIGRNTQIALEASNRMQDVTDIADSGKEQVQQLDAIVTEILDGSRHVLEAVSEIQAS